MLWGGIITMGRLDLQDQQGGNPAFLRQLVDGDVEHRACGADLSGCDHRKSMGRGG